jgi:major intracellular serine protease
MKKVMTIMLVMFLTLSLIGIALASSHRDSTDKISPYLLENQEIDVDVWIKNPETREFLTQTEFNNFANTLDQNKIREIIYPELVVLKNINLEQIKQLSKRPEVEYVLPSFNLQMQLNDAGPLIQADTAWEQQISETYLTGESQTIMVVDTSANLNHPDLIDKNILGGILDCTASIECPLIEQPEPENIPNSHGTHVAGIAGANGEIFGIGKNANIINAKVFEEGDYNINSAFIIRGINWAMNQDELNINVITISIGSTETFGTFCDGVYPPIETAINNAYEQGITLTIGSGNGGNDEAISYPACHSNVIPVGATTKQDYLAWYTNYNEELVDIMAPGSSIYSTLPNNNYGPMSGTSMATPMVAGAMSILYQALELSGQEATPHQLEQLLFETGDPINNLPYEFWRRINVNNAIMYFVPPACADCTEDGLVNVEDLVRVILDWGECDPIPEACLSDLTKDGVVGLADLMRVLFEWETTCGQEAQAPQPLNEREIEFLNKLINQNLPETEVNSILEELDFSNRT